ncbi:BQ2448_2345 [Microbotryum intermedium]|uniref:BQ2448_2345 protein n=1 Tax=Microbotryum intermedium TaxID=269621 RepID=A0A238F802_9BASI|nr:BQ2448_2345 [Microbotryum intermedium]
MRIAAFATSNLLCDASSYQDWVLTLCSCLPSDVLEYLKLGVPHKSWPSTYVPLWDHYARALICTAVNPCTVLPGLSRYFDDACSTHKIWDALPEPMPDTPDSFLQFHDRFENDSRLLDDSKVTVDSLLTLHLRPGSCHPSPRGAQLLPCLNPTCHKLHWLNECLDTAWATTYCARKATNGGSKRGNKKGSQPAASPAIVETPEPTTFTTCLLATPAKVSLLNLHRRLAHLPIAQIKNIVQKGLVTGVDCLGHQ